MADGVWKGVYPYGFGRSKQLSLNKFFDPSSPSMRKGCDGGGERGEKRYGIVYIMIYVNCSALVYALSRTLF